MSTQDALTSVPIAENHELGKQSISDSEDMDTSADHAPPIGYSNGEETEDQHEPSSPQYTPRKFINAQKIDNDRYPGLSRRPSLSVATNTGDSSAHTASLIDHVLPDEEPSSALGKRIFSAQSNPSPPPSPLLSGVRAHIPLVDLDTGSDEPTTPEPTISTHDLGIPNGVSPFASATHLDLNVDFRPHAGPAFMVRNSIDPTANLISFESPVMPATHKSTAYPTSAQTEVLQEPEVGMLGEGHEPTQPSQSTSNAAEVSTPNMTPRLRRSARLSATPQSTLPALGQKSATYRSSPLKHGSIDEEVIAAMAGSLPRPQALKVVKKSTQQGLDPFSLIADSSQGSPTRSAALEPGRTRRKGRVRSTSPMPAIDGQPSVEPAPVVLTDTANSGKRVRRRERGTHIAEDSVAPLSPGSAGVLQSIFSDVQPPTNEPLQPSLPVFDSDPTLTLGVTDSSEIQNPETPQRSKPIFPTRPNQLAAGSKAVRSPARVPSPVRSQPNLPPNSPMKAMAALEAYPQPPLRRVVPNTNDKAPASSAGNNSHALPRLGSGNHKLARVVPPKPPSPQPLVTEPVAESIVSEEILLAPVANSSILLPHPVLPSRIPSPSKARLRTPSDSSDGKPASGIQKPGLRQGSHGASRIPRIAPKPYARTPSAKKPASDDSTSKVSVKNSAPSIVDQQNGHATLNIQAVESLMSPPPSSLKRKRTDSASVQPITTQMDQMSVITEATITEPSKPLQSGGFAADRTTRVTAGSRRVTNKTTYPEYVEVDTEDNPSGTPTLVSADTMPTRTIPMAVSHDAPIPEANVEDIQEPPLRRTARSKRNVVRPGATITSAPTLPVAGTPRPPPRHRRSTVDNMLFGGMTRTAIEALSQKHTDHNSTYYYAILETELVKRPGNRPESPGMKIRTIAQREAEEAERGRSERAERRARRSGDDMEDDEMHDDVLPALEITPLEHVIGAGEDEPFKTPPKSESATKRARLDNEENLPCKKGVRWSKGLFTVTYLDEIEVKERKALREGFQGAGCLAPSAKALQLDSLGNLLSVSVPLGNLGNENITVQKFVYEDDEVPQIIVPEPEPVAPPPAKKVTRARKKT